jgi:hypothetical protein
MSDQASERPIAVSEQPLHGWLLVFILWEVLSLAGDCGGTAYEFNVAGQNAPDAAGAVASVALLLVLLLVVSRLRGLYLIIRRRKQSRRFWLLFLSFSIPVLLAQSCLAVAERPVLAASEGGVMTGLAVMAPNTLFRVTVTAVWLWYWTVSKRVKRTFEERRTKTATGLSGSQNGRGHTC